MVTLFEIQTVPSSLSFCFTMKWCLPKWCHLSGTLHFQLWLGHFWITFCTFSKPGLVLNHSYENEFNLHVSENLQLHWRMSTRTCFKKNEAKGKSDITYCVYCHFRFYSTGSKFNAILGRWPSLYRFVS